MQANQNTEQQVVFVPVTNFTGAGGCFSPAVQMMGTPHLAVVPVCAVSSPQHCQPVDQRVTPNGNCAWMAPTGESNGFCGSPAMEAPTSYPGEGPEVVLLQGLPKDLANEECLEAALEQAGFEEEDICTIKVQPGGKGTINVTIALASAKVAEACAAHFHGLLWGNMSTPLIATCGRAGSGHGTGRKGNMARGKGGHKYSAHSYRGDHGGLWRDGSMRRGNGKAGYPYIPAATTGTYGWQGQSEEIPHQDEHKASDMQAALCDLQTEGSQWEERSTASSSSELSSLTITTRDKGCGFDSGSDDARSTTINSTRPARTSSAASSLSQSPGNRMRWADSISDDEEA